MVLFFWSLPAAPDRWRGLESRPTNKLTLRTHLNSRAWVADAGCWDLNGKCFVMTNETGHCEQFEFIAQRGFYVGLCKYKSVSFVIHYDFISNLDVRQET